MNRMDLRTHRIVNKPLGNRAEDSGIFSRGSVKSFL